MATPQQLAQWYGIQVDPNQSNGIPQLNQIDPLTGQPFTTQSFGPGAGSAGAEIQHGFALDTQFQNQQALALQQLMGALGMSNQFIQGGFQGDLTLARNLTSLGAADAGAQKLVASQATKQSLAQAGMNGNSGVAAHAGYQLNMANNANVRTAQTNALDTWLKLQEQQRLAGLSALVPLNNTFAQVQMAQPTAGTNALQGGAELAIQYQELQDAKHAAKKQSSNQLLGGFLGLGTGVLQGALAGLGL